MPPADRLSSPKSARARPRLCVTWIPRLCVTWITACQGGKRLQHAACGSTELAEVCAGSAAAVRDLDHGLPGRQEGPGAPASMVRKVVAGRGAGSWRDLLKMRDTSRLACVASPVLCAGTGVAQGRGG
jgi:hypothetical protein